MNLALSSAMRSTSVRMKVMRQSISMAATLASVSLMPISAAPTLAFARSVDQ